MHSEVTKLLVAVRQGCQEAPRQLFAALYDELHAHALRAMGGQRRRHTLQPTALIHEVFCKLVRGGQEYRDRRHFFGVACRAMRQILVDHAKSKNRAKRAGKRVHLDEVLAAVEERVPNVAALHESIERLAKRDSRMAEIFDLHFFGGLPATEIARLLAISVRTVNRDVETAKALLARELAE